MEWEKKERAVLVLLGEIGAKMERENPDYVAHRQRGRTGKKVT